MQSDVSMFFFLFRNGSLDSSSVETFKIPPPLPKRDMTLEELRKYDGKGEDGRICIAILGKVYDCSKGKPSKSLLTQFNYTTFFQDFDSMVQMVRTRHWRAEMPRALSHSLMLKQLKVTLIINFPSYLC